MVVLYTAPHAIREDKQLHSCCCYPKRTRNEL
jgi:hypothetical protein